MEIFNEREEDFHFDGKETEPTVSTYDTCRLASAQNQPCPIPLSSLAGNSWCKIGKQSVTVTCTYIHRINILGTTGTCMSDKSETHKIQRTKYRLCIRAGLEGKAFGLLGQDQINFCCIYCNYNDFGKIHVTKESLETDRTNSESPSCIRITATQHGDWQQRSRKFLLFL